MATSLLDYMFDSDWKQRGDIDRLREAHDRDSANTQLWLSEIKNELTELAATVRVLTRKLAQADLLDPVKLREEIADELKVQHKGPTAGPVVCRKCAAKGISSEMVKIGSDWMCRPCARNP